MPSCSSSLRGPMPEYSSSRGVSTEPAATMISLRAAIRSRAPESRSTSTAVARPPDVSMRIARDSVWIDRFDRRMHRCRYITDDDERTPVAGS